MYLLRVLMKDDAHNEFYDRFIPQQISVVKKSNRKPKNLFSLTDNGMNIKLKAFCGDGILQCCIGELNTSGYDVSLFLSNRSLMYCYFRLTGNDLTDRRSRKQHAYGTKMEAMIYDVFKSKGYEAAKKYVSEAVYYPLVAKETKSKLTKTNND